MKRPTFLYSVICLFLLGVGCWLYADAFPNRHAPVGWIFFCCLSAALGLAQILVAGCMTLIGQGDELRWQLFLSGLMWLLVGGAICAAPMLIG